MTTLAPSPSSQTRLDIPMPRLMPLRSLISSTLLFGFLAFFCGLALFDLLDYPHSEYPSLIASALWLLLVATVLGGLLREFGPRQLSINFLSHFALHHYLQLTPEATLEFNFSLLGLTLHQLIIEAAAVEKISWSMGQRSHYAHRDTGDWQIAIWFPKNAIRIGRLGYRYMKDRPELFLIGQPGPCTRVIPFAHQLADFLRHTGIPLHLSPTKTAFTATHQ